MSSSYLLSNNPGELERLQTQSRVWETAGRALLARVPNGAGRHALDVGCGAMGWLRILSTWVGPHGRVTGSDLDEKMLGAARAFVAAEALANVELARDDLFASALPAHSFDLVHARFQLAPLGRAGDQLAVYRRLLRPGGWLMLEEPDLSSWRANPDAPAVARLIALIEKGFAANGGNFNAGRELAAHFRQLGAEPSLHAAVIALRGEHPYFRLPLQFANSLRPRLEALIGKTELDALIAEAEKELSRPDAWGLTFTLVQAWSQLP